MLEKVTVFKVFVKRLSYLIYGLTDDRQNIDNPQIVVVSHIMPASKRLSVKAWATFIPMENHSDLPLPVLQACLWQESMQL